MKFILINHIEVQNSNAVSGFTYGFPSVTHFLGFTHNISRELKADFSDIKLKGCVIVSHKTKTHEYKDKYHTRFTQNKCPVYLTPRIKDPSIIEEGKMNMTISLLIPYDGEIGNRNEDFLALIESHCFYHHLAGGTVTDIKSIELYDTEESGLFTLKKKLQYGFILKDRSRLLEPHFLALKEENKEIDMMDAFIDFIGIKQQARPEYDLLSEAILATKSKKLINQWDSYLTKPYSTSIPHDIKYFFEALDHEKTQKQWSEYCSPTEKTKAIWETIKKPEKGYLIPVTTGYKAISPLYDNTEVENTRDSSTPVRFVEAIHSIAEWVSIYRTEELSDLEDAVWHYSNDNDFYLCSNK